MRKQQYKNEVDRQLAIFNNALHAKQYTLAADALIRAREALFVELEVTDEAAKDLRDVDPRIAVSELCAVRSKVSAAQQEILPPLYTEETESTSMNTYKMLSARLPAGGAVTGEELCVMHAFKRASVMMGQNRHGFMSSSQKSPAQSGEPEAERFTIGPQNKTLH